MNLFSPINSIGWECGSGPKGTIRIIFEPYQFVIGEGSINLEQGGINLPFDSDGSDGWSIMIDTTKYGNGLYETSDPGVGDVLVRVGNKEVKTNKFGWYFTRIAAKRAIVDLDASTLPEGYFISTNDTFKIDIDQFKIYNDLYGHASGDVALKRIAEIIQTVTSDKDLLVRNI